MRTQNKKINKIMGCWNMKTLSLTSYNRAANIWIEEVRRKHGEIECATIKRIERKLKEMKVILDIP